MSEEQLSSSAKKLGDPIRPAIALQPPYQPSVSGVSYLAERNNVTGDRDSPPPLLPLKPQEPPPTIVSVIFPLFLFNCHHSMALYAFISLADLIECCRGYPREKGG